MLSHFRGDVGVAILGEFVEALDRVLRLDDFVRVAIGQRILRAPFADLRPPGVERLPVRLDAAVAPNAQHILKHMGAIADDRHIDFDILVDG